MHYIPLQSMILGACREAYHLLYLKGQSLDVIQGPCDGWKLAMQVGATAADSPCVGMCFKAYPPVLTLTLLLPAMELVSVEPQSSNAQLGIVSQLSCRALLSLFCVSLESTILLCCGTEIPQPTLLPDLIWPHMLHTHTY